MAHEAIVRRQVFVCSEGLNSCDDGFSRHEKLGSKRVCLDLLEFSASCRLTVSQVNSDRVIDEKRLPAMKYEMPEAHGQC